MFLKLDMNVVCLVKQNSELMITENKIVYAISLMSYVGLLGQQPFKIRVSKLVPGGASALPNLSPTCLNTHAWKF